MSQSEDQEFRPPQSGIRWPPQSSHGGAAGFAAPDPARPMKANRSDAHLPAQRQGRPERVHRLKFRSNSPTAAAYPDWEPIVRPPILIPPAGKPRIFEPVVPVSSRPLCASAEYFPLISPRPLLPTEISVARSKRHFQSGNQQTKRQPTVARILHPSDLFNMKKQGDLIFRTIRMPAFPRDFHAALAAVKRQRVRCAHCSGSQTP